MSKIERNCIYCMDNVAGMAMMDADSVDLTVTSPPYDYLRRYGNSEPVWDFENVAKQLYRVTSPGGVVIWIVNDSSSNGEGETGTSFRQCLGMMDAGFKLWDTMIYEKDGCHTPETRRYYQVFEFMFVFSKGAPKTVNQIKDRLNVWRRISGKYTRREKNGKLKNDYRNYESDVYGVRYNIWRYSTGKGKTTLDKEAFIHPAMFPEKIAETTSYLGQTKAI